jgi:hypothetical protein
MTRADIFLSFEGSQSRDALAARIFHPMREALDGIPA